MFLVHVPGSPEHTVCQVETTKHGQEPVEQVQIVQVHVLPMQPPLLARGDPSHDRVYDIDKDCAQEVAERQRQPRERSG